MKATLKFTCFFALLLMGRFVAVAQIPTQLIVANGGIYGPGNYVKIGAWNFGTGNYAIFDSIPATSVQSVHIHGRDAYVCADSFLVRYNLDTYQREATAKIFGVRKVAVWEDKVLVTKGVGAIGSTFEVRYAENLYPCFSVPEITGNCAGVAVVGDTGYVANPVSFVYPYGNLAVIDMPGRSWNRTMDMDTMGKFIDNLYVHNGNLVSINIVKFNNPQWGFISQYDVSNGSFVHHRVGMGISQGAGIDGNLLFANFGGNVGSFDLGTGLIADANVVPGTWAGMTLDSVNHRLFLTETDYQTHGWLYVFDYNGTALDTLPVGISPVAMAVDYGVTVGMPGEQPTKGTIKAFPQPFGDRLQVDLRTLGAAATELTLLDLTGRKLLHQTLHGNGLLSLEVPNLGAGAYLLQVRTRTGVETIKVIHAGL